MLQHYSPFKVAESFRLLAALAPAIASISAWAGPRRPAADHRGLAGCVSDKSAPLDFAALAEELEGHLTGDLARPLPRVAPRRVAARRRSPESGALARPARLGIRLRRPFQRRCGADRGKPGRLSRRRWPSAALAVHAFAASSTAAARACGAETRIFRVTLSDGRAVNGRSREQAGSFARQAGDTRVHDPRDASACHRRYRRGRSRRARCAGRALRRDGVRARQSCSRRCRAAAFHRA